MSVSREFAPYLQYIHKLIVKHALNKLPDPYAMINTFEGLRDEGCDFRLLAPLFTRDDMMAVIKNIEHVGILSLYRVHVVASADTNIIRIILGQNTIEEGALQYYVQVMDLMRMLIEGRIIRNAFYCDCNNCGLICEYSLNTANPTLHVIVAALLASGISPKVCFTAKCVQSATSNCNHQTRLNGWGATPAHIHEYVTRLQNNAALIATIKGLIRVYNIVYRRLKLAALNSDYRRESARLSVFVSIICESARVDNIGVFNQAAPLWPVIGASGLWLVFPL